MESLAYISISPVSAGAFHFFVDHPSIVLVLGVTGMLVAFFQWRKRHKIIAK